MKKLAFILILIVWSNQWTIAKTSQISDLLSHNFDEIIFGTTSGVSVNGTVTFTNAKWTYDESIGTGTNSTWNKFYSNQVFIAKDASGANPSNYITSTNDRLSSLFAAQTSGTVELEVRVKTPATTGSSGFISIDNDPSATSINAIGRANLIYFNTTASGSTTISHTNSTQVLVSGLAPATWYYIKVVYYITGINAGKWDMYYGATEPTTLITATPIAYQTSASAFALQRLYIAGPFFMDDIRIYQAPLVESSLSAQTVVNKMVLFEPIRDAASSFSVVPTIDAKYSATIISTSPSGIIKTDGTVISRPATTTFVDVTVQVQNKTNAADIATKTLQLKVTPTFVAPQANLADAQANFSRKKVGFFVHYVPFLTAGKTAVIYDINVLANDFDAIQFAQDAADFGVEYVVFTAWHARMLPLFPSKVSKKWRDDRRTIPQMQSYSDRDVIADLITALNAKNIDLHLYIHPTDGHDFTDRGLNDNILQDQALTGYTDAANNYAYWNQYINELLNEVCERYGTGVKGFWIDGGANRIDVARLRKTLRSYNPNAMIVENVGGNRSASVSTPGITGMADHNAWEVNSIRTGTLSFLTANPNVVQTDAKTWPTFLPQVAFVVGNGWWAKAGANTTPYTAKDLYLYNILMASLNKSGGMLYSTGVYAGKASDYANGNIWDGTGAEGNIYATLKAVNDYIKPIAESIKNTNAGKAYPSNSSACSWLDQYQWGVSTESADNKYVYLHVVKPPAGKLLSIAAPADNSSFANTAILLNSKQTIGCAKTATGYDITLPDSKNWDAINTVIRLERLNFTSSKNTLEKVSAVRVVDSKLLISSDSVQHLDVFSIDGAKLLSRNVVVGENSFLFNRKGLFVFCLRDANGSFSDKIMIQ